MHELTLLYPPPPTLDPNHYPLLTLHSTTITVSSTPVNLLLHPGPFRITGVLSTIPRKHHPIVRIDAALRKPKITLNKVETWALERKRGETVVWVLGRCAWYKVVPGEEYEAVFAEVRRLAETWMWVRDAWGVEGEDVGEAWKQYANDHPEEVRTPRAAGKWINSCWRFLVKMMAESEESEEWRKSCLWREFELTNKEEMDEIVAAANKTSTTDSQEPRARTPLNPAPRRRRGRPPRTTKADPPPLDPPTTTADDHDEDEDDDDDDDDDDNEDDESSSSDTDTDAPQTPSHRRTGKNPSATKHSSLRPAPRPSIPLDPSSPPSPPPPPVAAASLKRKQPSFSHNSHPAPDPSCPPSSEEQDKRHLTERDWSCPRCEYSVKNARTREGRHAVEEHYKTHRGRWVEALKTVEEEVEEEKVGHLLGLLREMRGRWEEGLSPLRGLE